MKWGCLVDGQRDNVGCGEEDPHNLFHDILLEGTELSRIWSTCPEYIYMGYECLCKGVIRCFMKSLATIWPMSPAS